MLPYWSILLFLAFGSFLHDGTFIPKVKSYRNVFLLFAVILITLMIGLRYKVGGDWPTYDEILG